jgi:enterochelin esterase family protein
MFALLVSLAIAQTTPIKNFDEAYRAVGKGNPDVVRWFGAESAAAGQSVRLEGNRAIYVLRTEPSARRVRVMSTDGKWSRTMRRVGEAWACAATYKDGTAFRWRYEIDGKPFGGGEMEAFVEPPECKPAPEALRGTLTEQPEFRSTTFPGTRRRWWIYVPRGHDPAKPATLTIVQDAQWMRGYWVNVLDNLVGARQIPATIGIFLTPGTIERDLDNRSLEYDSVTDRYATMLVDEIIPEVARRYKVRQDPAGRLIAGLSSGGICAFNAAWQRPDAFGKVVSWIGSFTNLQGGPTGVAGGNTFPAMIRARRGWDRNGAPKPIRVFLQAGTNDLDNRAGNWPLANQEMAKALEFGGYDYKLVMGEGFHSHRHGLAILPDTLRWMWRDER